MEAQKNIVFHHLHLTNKQILSLEIQVDHSIPYLIHFQEPTNNPVGHGKIQ
jgi:hypothetical protein